MWFNHDFMKLRKYILCAKKTCAPKTDREENKLLKEHFTFLKIGSFDNSPRVKQLSFTVFESIQPISVSAVALLA